MGNTEIEITNKGLFFDNVRSVDFSELISTNYPSIGFQATGRIEINLKGSDPRKETFVGNFSSDYFEDEYGFILKTENDD